MLDKEYKYFKDNLPKLIKQYENKFLVIKGLSVDFVANSYNEALQFALNKYELGQFLIQLCQDSSKTTAQFVNSYVVVHGQKA